MNALEDKYNSIENGEVELSLKLITKKENKLIALFRAIKKLIFGEKTQKDSDIA